jgi:hypothetical protein
VIPVVSATAVPSVAAVTAVPSVAAVLTVPAGAVPAMATSADAADADDFAGSGTNLNDHVPTPQIFSGSGIGSATPVEDLDLPEALPAQNPADFTG